MDLPARLTADDCHLLRREPDRLAPVLAKFDAAFGLAHELVSRFPQHAAQPDVVAAIARMAEVRTRLTRERYLVGLLGGYGSGKSTTLNSLLGLGGTEKLADEGAGKATTSVVTRLRVAPAGTTPALALRYFTVEEYYRRRDTLAEWIGVTNPAGQSEQNLLKLLEHGLPHLPPGSSRRPPLEDDLPYLRGLLNSYLTHKALVRGSHQDTEPADFRQRARVLNHDLTQKEIRPSPYMLLAEAFIDYPTDQIDPELEIVDCPGVGANRSVDTLLTTEFIAHLDGAILFLKADELYPGRVIEIIQALKHHYKNKLASRVWVVVTKVDIPDRDSKLIGRDGKTFFDLVAELEQVHQIPLQQIGLFCRFLADRYAASGTLDPAWALEKLNLRPEDATELFAGMRQKYPPLGEALGELLKDGGVGHLRRLIREKIAKSVAAEIRDTADQALTGVIASLQYAITVAQNPLGQEERTHAVRWRNAILIALHALGDRSPGFEAAGRGLRDLLTKVFIDNLPPDEVLRRMTPLELITLQYPLDADGILQPELDREIPQRANLAFDEVKAQLRGHNLADVQLPNGRKLLELVEEYQAEDRARTDWVTASRPRFYHPELAARMKNPQLAAAFNGDAYKRLMTEKIRTASYQTALVVRTRIRTRLETLLGLVNRLIWTPDGQLA